MSGASPRDMASGHYIAELRRLLGANAAMLGALGVDVESLARRDTVFIAARAGQLFGDATADIDAVRFVVEGFVKIVCAVPGRQRPLIVRILGPGEFVCLPARPFAAGVGVLAHTDATLASLPIHRVGNAFGAGLHKLQSHWWVSDVRLGVYKTVLLGLPLAGRVIHELRGLVPRFGRRQADGWLLDLPLYHVDIADLVAGTRSNVTRCLVSLMRDGLLDRVHRRLLLRDRFMTLDLAPSLQLGDSMPRPVAPDGRGTDGRA